MSHGYSIDHPGPELGEQGRVRLDNRQLGRELHGVGQLGLVGMRGGTTAEWLCVNASSLEYLVAYAETVEP